MECNVTATATATARNWAQFHNQSSIKTLSSAIATGLMVLPI